MTGQLKGEFQVPSTVPLLSTWYISRTFITKLIHLGSLDLDHALEREVYETHMEIFNMLVNYGTGCAREHGKKYD